LIWFWIYVGGCLGWTMCQLTSPDVRNMHARNWHVAQLRSAFWGPVVVVAASLIGITLWPLMLLGWLLGAEQVLRKWLSKLYMRTRITCPTCGFQSEVSIPRDAQRWFEFPAGWYVNEQLEFACSPACARHIEVCPHRDRADSDHAVH